VHVYPLVFFYYFIYVYIETQQCTEPDGNKSQIKHTHAHATRKEPKTIFLYFEYKTWHAMKSNRKNVTLFEIKHNAII